MSWERDQQRAFARAEQQWLTPPDDHDYGEEEILAAYQDAEDRWHDGETNLFVTAAKARELLGPYGRNHAEKCACESCQISRAEWKEYEGRDGE